MHTKTRRVAKNLNQGCIEGYGGRGGMAGEGGWLTFMTYPVYEPRPHSVPANNLITILTNNILMMV